MARRNLRRIYTLTAQPEGPTGQQMEQIAQEIVEVAQENAGEILHKLVRAYPEVLNTIQYSRRGNEIVVGVRPDRPAGSDNAGFFLAQKEQREHIWLTPAVEEVMRRHQNVTVTRGSSTSRVFGKVSRQ